MPPTKTNLLQLVFFWGAVGVCVILLMGLPALAGQVLLLGMVAVGGGVLVRSSLGGDLRASVWHWGQTALAALRRLYTPPILTVLMVVLALVNGHWLRIGTPSLLEMGSWLGLLLLTIGAIGQFNATRPAPISLHSPLKIRWIFLLGGLAGLLALAAINGQWLGGTYPEVPLSHHGQFVLLVGSLGLLALTPLESWWLRPFLNWEWAGVLALTLFAFGLRVWGVDTRIRVMVDELLFAEGIMKYWRVEAQPLVGIIGGLAPYSQVYTYLEAWGVEILGRNFLGLRITSVILGSLTIPAVYYWARSAYDKQTAIGAAVLLATFAPHLHFSRIGLNQVFDPLFGTLALGLLTSGILHQRSRDYFWAGMALGLTQYGYEGGRIVYLALFGGALAGLWVVGQPRPKRRDIFLTLGVAALVALPFYTTFAAADLPIFPRLGVAGFGDDKVTPLYSPAAAPETQWFSDFSVAMMAYFRHPDPTLFYGGRQPYLLVFVLPFTLIGGLVTLWDWRNPRIILLLLVVGNALGNSFVRDVGLATRYVTTFPALAILTAVGVRFVVQGLTQPLARQYLLLGVVMGGLAFGQAYYYFEVHLEDFNRQTRPSYDGTDALLRSLDFPPQTQIYLIGETNTAYYAVMFGFFRSDKTLTVIPPDTLTAEYLTHLPRWLDLAFYLQPQDQASLALLQARFQLQEPQVTTNPDVPPEKSYILYYAAAIDNVPPLR